MRWITAPDLFDSPSPELIEYLYLSKIARMYHVAPWDLAKAPAIWREVGEIDFEIQNHARMKGE
ncbi:MAG: hypothetical protein CVU46_11090 [Chloroflexi bacterium HGW-Chloroflexi-8]|nr:MAG: hypothetical protein CVU46_11090 [Chloroflexi bacterium HGW-Chloroflexi-8]